MREHSEKTPIKSSTKGIAPQSPVRNQPSGQRMQKSKETDASIGAQSKAIADKHQMPDRTRVAEVAYGLYEQRGWEDGQDLADWFEAERRIVNQGA